jgi:hypothetical protein
MKEIMAEMAINMAKEYLKLGVVQLITVGKQHLSQEEYKSMLKAGDEFFCFGAMLAAKTKTSIDDVAVQVFSEPIKAAIGAEGI